MAVVMSRKSDMRPHALKCQIFVTSNGAFQQSTSVPSPLRGDTRYQPTLMVGPATTGERFLLCLPRSTQKSSSILNGPMGSRLLPWAWRSRSDGTLERASTQTVHATTL